MTESISAHKHDPHSELARALEAAGDALLQAARLVAALPAPSEPAPAEPARGLSVKEAAALLGISRDSLERRIRDGKIRAVPLGGRRLIPVAEVERLLSTEAAR